MRTNLSAPDLTLGRKLLSVHWLLVLLIAGVAGVGFAMLYSAAGGNMAPWAERQMMRFGVGMLIMLVVATIDIRIWLRYAYILYFVAHVMLVGVDVGGYVGMGAQRWISLGVINIQPSELMKIFMVLALARYFHGISVEDIGRISRLIVPIVMVAVPTALILRQPDLGTAIMLTMTAGAVMFLAGVRLWKFAVVGVAVPID